MMKGVVQSVDSGVAGSADSGALTFVFIKAPSNATAVDFT
jgi:hypothetical protein